MVQRSQPGRRGRGRVGPFAFLALVALAATLLAPAARASDEWSAPRTVFIPTSGHTVDGLFLDAWRGNPGLLGPPISEELPQRVAIADGKTAKLTVQYFQNLALAYSPNDSRGEEWTVFALPLGKDALAADEKRLSGTKLPKTGSCGGLPAESCRVFSETKHSVRLGFKAYWDANGAEQMIGLPLTEEFVGGDGWTTQYFERAVLVWKKNQDVQPRAIGKEAAKRLDLKTAEIAQPVGVPVYDEALFVPPIAESVGGVGGELGAGPGPIQGGSKEIVVSVSQQAMWAYEDGEVVISSLVSTGIGEVPETETPRGAFSVLVKYDLQTMEGTISGEYYRVPDVPWVMYFDNSGNALHGTYWHNNFGQRMSHGCVNLPLDVAEFLYGWAPEGTLVTIID